MRRTLTFVLLAAVTMMGTALVASEYGSGKPSDSHQQAVHAPAPAGNPAPARVSAYAWLRPKDGVLMLTGPATDFGYWIGRLDVKEGDMVKAGQALAELDVKRERAATLSVRRAQVQEAEVIAHFAERELARKEKLTRVISLKDLDSARNSGELAAAKLEAARRPESYAEIMLDQATIRAPVAGMILRILKHEGEGFAPGQGLIELGRVAHMEAVAEVFETNVRFVVPGQRATFKSPALAGPVQGKVLRIMPKLDRIKLYETNAGENVENRVVRLVIGLGDDPATKSLTGLQGIVTINTSRSP